MQVYKSPGGVRYVVVDGRVYGKPTTGYAFRSEMTVERYLELIGLGVLRFEKVIKPIMTVK